MVRWRARLRYTRDYFITGIGGLSQLLLKNDLISRQNQASLCTAWCNNVTSIAYQPFVSNIWLILLYLAFIVRYIYTWGIPSLESNEKVNIDV